MKITFVISTLRQGGAERVCVLLAEEFCQQGHEVSMVILGDQSKDFFHLNERISCVYLKLQKPSPNLLLGLWNNIKRISVLRKEILRQNSDCVISFMNQTNVLCALALLGLKTKLIGTEHTDPSLPTPGPIWKFLRRKLYGLSDKFVFPSEGIRKYFHWLADEKCTVIPNPLPPMVKTEKEVFQKEGKKWIMAAGRLFWAKGFDGLIRVFKELSHEFPEWNLLILGEGVERGALEKIIKEEQLFTRVFLPGEVKNILGYFSQADLFVLSSKYEGFGNVLVEALACGVPAVAFDCPVGPREILRSEDDGGILAPHNDWIALQEAMRKLMQDDQERKRLATSALKTRDRFDCQKIANRWNEVFQEIVKL